MKRDPALTPLSHDHHQALFLALRLRRVSEDDAAEVREDVLRFFEEHGLRHFAIEEDVLLPGCAHRLDPSDPAVQRVLDDHAWFRDRLRSLERDELDLGGMKQLGDRLDAHIRHEERFLFPAIEDALDDSELGRLGREIELAENA